MQEIDHHHRDAQDPNVDSEEGGLGHSRAVTQTENAEPSDPVTTIVIASRAYHQLMRAEKPLELQVKAYFRMMGRLANEEQAKEKEKATHKSVLKLKRTVPPEIDTVSRIAIGLGIDPVVFAIDVHRASLERYRNEQAKILEATAKELSVWRWVDSVRGIGALNLALIVGGAGAPLWPDYANPAKLWKRFGLAVLSDGKAQRRVADKELAIEAGFSPTRRATMHNVGESLMKQNKREDGEPGKYREIYLERKEYEAERLPDAKPIYPHRRALRYMEKKFLVDLWEAWKRAA